MGGREIMSYLIIQRKILVFFFGVTLSAVPEILKHCSFIDFLFCSYSIYVCVHLFIFIVLTNCFGLICAVNLSINSTKPPSCSHQLWQLHHNTYVSLWISICQMCHLSIRNQHKCKYSFICSFPPLRVVLLPS